MRTRSLRQALRGAALALAAAWATASPAAPAEDAEVVSVMGRCEAKPTPREDWAPAAVRQKLNGGAFVRTGDLSQMALLMRDQTQLRLNQNSMMQIKEASSATAPARLELRAGRAWMQAKGPAVRVVVDTPNATAAIRGTEWELEADPEARRTRLAVFSGEVEFSNASGSVTLVGNEAAIAEDGKAPVKIVLTRPRDRIQWVNAFAIETRRYAAGASPRLRAALDAVERGDLASARALAAAEVARGSRETATHALLADIELAAGDFARAIAVTEAALAWAPRDPELLAQLAREQLYADDPEAARRTLARPRDAESVAVLVAEGEVARRDGLAPRALESFARAARAAPEDDRGWFALGRAQAEREDTRPARRNLARALELDPAGPGYAGELGTLETFANRFAAAQPAFDSALQANPRDYVAYTGLGLLRLKRGDPAGALEALLRAGMLEPRYARARTFTAVAYYQLGRHADAIATFLQAGDLDDKDPLPYLYLTQVYTDLFRAADAVAASREAMKRLPFLKSLNQVANNQRGTGNFGYALAFSGLEQWALEIAQQSYNPHLAVSHLFLADRYPGTYNRNSELFQGFLTDPTAFGGSNRFSTLTPSAGRYGTLGSAWTYSEDRLGNPYVRLNGLVDGPFRSAYFVDAEGGVGTVETTDTDLDGKTVNVRGDRRVELYALGLGGVVTDGLALFTYGTRVLDEVVLRDESGTTGTLARDRLDIGVRYRFSPDSMTWLKVGRGDDNRAFRNYFVFSSDYRAAFASGSTFESTPADVQARHSIDLTPADHLAFGAEQATEKREANLRQVGLFLDEIFGIAGYGFAVDQKASLRSRQAYLSYVRDVGPRLSLQGDVFWQQFRQDIDELQLLLLRFGELGIPISERFGGEDTMTEWNPRAGAVFRSGNVVARAAWQRWMQPAADSTLAPVATAGIPVDDRLVAAGGKAERTALQLAADLGANTHVTAFYDNEKVKNFGKLGYRIPVPPIQFVDLLRNRQLENVATSDLLEGKPDFDSGRVESGGIVVDHLLGAGIALSARYVHTDNRASIYVQGEEGAVVVNDDARIPYVPRHLAALTFTWTSPQRIYLSAQAVYRSERFADRDNEQLRKPDTTGAIAAFWESRDKRVIVGIGASNIGSKVAKESYVVDARIRF